VSRFVPTLAQLEEARRQLPSSYSVLEGRNPPYYRVALRVPLDPYFVRHATATMVRMAEMPVVDFRLEKRSDPDGFTWTRWVYDGPVAV
jgi:hypothetical protein